MQVVEELKKTLQKHSNGIKWRQNKDISNHSIRLQLCIEKVKGSQ